MLALAMHSATLAEQGLRYCVSERTFLKPTAALCSKIRKIAFTTGVTSGPNSIFALPIKAYMAAEQVKV
jgi:hypothetical protein